MVEIMPARNIKLPHINVPDEEEPDYCLAPAWYKTYKFIMRANSYQFT